MNRLYGLDTLRGLTLVSMIAYHACWDLVWMFGMDWDWYRGQGAFFWQQSICWTFILLSGYCWSLGRRHLCRGLTVFAAGALVSAVTLIAMPENAVRFGVLTLLGSASLLLIPLERILHRVPARLGLVGSFFLFGLLRNVSDGFVGLGGTVWFHLPENWYCNAFSAYLGFPPPGFFPQTTSPCCPGCRCSSPAIFSGGCGRRMPPPAPGCRFSPPWAVIPSSSICSTSRFYTRA